MSGQAKRSRWRYLVRRREVLARLLAKAHLDNRGIRTIEPTVSNYAAAISDGESFDVHAARELAHSLIALEAEQMAFEDWTREQGMGPENRERGAFVSVETDADWGDLAWAHAEGFFKDQKFAPAWTSYGIPKRGGCPGKLAREWPGDSRAPMGRTLAKLGLDLLAALEGQPSECQACEGHGHVWKDSEVPEAGTRLCSDCHGTGHNLRGVLPAVEVSAVLRRKVCDGAASLRRAQHVSRDLHAKTWTRQLNRAWERWRAGLPGYGVYRGTAGTTMSTRVVPRGEHRGGLSRVSARPGSTSEGFTLDERITARRWGQNHGVPVPDNRMPRWARGELRQGRVNAQRRAVSAVD